MSGTPAEGKPHQFRSRGRHAQDDEIERDDRFRQNDLGSRVYDGLSARIAQAAGASLLYATGGGIARSTGIPDMGLINPVQITERLEQIVDAVDLPVIADFDTGYGNALNALFERV